MEPAFERIYDSSLLIHGGGVAIFHIASARVVLVQHPASGHWFLPKGRRDAGEEAQQAAEREGYEESGYRNRLIPLPVEHSQPKAHNPSEERTRFSKFVREPVCTHLTPFGRRNPYNHVQYIISWYIAETLPPDVEQRMQAQTAQKATATQPTPYLPPEPYPATLTIKERIAQDVNDYEPVKHERTGVDSDELTYQSFLLPIEEAIKHVKGRTHEHVIRTGWNLIQKRMKEEALFER